MAYGEQLTGESPRAFTIHVWPTRELKAQSWSWPECWRAAYEQVAYMLGLAVATQVLQGGSFAKRKIDIDTSIGCVQFTISQAGTTVHVTVCEFSGPHAPGPNGGMSQQPGEIGGLVLGLHESNGYFYVVVFHGVLSDIPSRNSLFGDVFYNVVCASAIVRTDEVLLDETQLGSMQLNWRGSYLDVINCCYTAREVAHIPRAPLALHEPKMQLSELRDIATREENDFRLSSRTLKWEPPNCDLAEFPNVYLSQRRSGHIHVHYLH